MYHSKVMILCWAAVYLLAIAAALIKRRWNSLPSIFIGAGIVAGGIAASALLNNALGALILSGALMVATYFTLIGLIKIFKK